MTIQKTHEYKVYSPLGVYLGKLAGVSSPFGYNQTIATMFAQMQVTVEQSPDVSALANEALTDESGNPILDESGNPILIESQPDVWGSLNSKALMVNNNLIKVYEYSNYHPNGTKVFDGYISKVKGTFGATDDIVLTCLSQGTDTNNLLVQSGDLAVTSQTTDDGSSVTSTDNAFGQWILQTFSVSTAYQISAISLELTATVQAQLQISIKQQLGTSPNPSTDPIVASGTATVPIQTKTVTKVSFTQPTTLNPAYTYYIQIFWQDTSNLTIFASSVKPYGGGSVYTLTSSGTTFNSPAIVANYSLYFIIYQHGGAVTGTYTNQDPSAILTDVMSNYTSQSGALTQPLSTLNKLFSQPFGDANIPGAFWGTAVDQIITPIGSNIVFDSIQIKLAAGSTTVPVPLLYKGDPSLDQVNVISGGFSYTLGGSNSAVSLPSVLSSTVNSITGIATIVFATPVTLTAGQAYYLSWQFSQGSYVALQGSSTLNAAPSSPFGALYSGLQTFNNGSTAMSKPAGIQAAYISLGLGAGISPNGGYANTGTITSYTFKMQTIQQALAAIFSLAPANWYYYADPATGELKFAQASTTADLKFIRGKHVNVLDIEATKENIRNVAYFTGGDDGSGTNTNILVKVTSTQGSNRIGLAQLSDNRVNATSGGVVAARLIAQNYLNNNAAETYITNVTILDQAMDINLIKLGMMVKIPGFGSFVDSLLLQVVGINRSPDQVQLQLGTLPLRDAKVVSQLQTQLAYQQTVANPTVAS